MFIRASLPLWDDHRARRTGQLIALIAALSLCDLAFTLWAHSFTPFHELNPFARRLLQGGMTTTLIAAKLALTVIGCGIFWRLRDRPGAEVGIWTVAAAYVLLTLRWADYTAMAGPLGF